MALNYYTKIKGKKYDRRLVELAEGLTSGKGDGRISIQDAKTLLRVVKDSNTYSAIEKSTMEYIRKHYKFTKEADSFFRTEIRKWAASKKAPRSKNQKQSTPPKIAIPTKPEVTIENKALPIETPKKPSALKQILLALFLLILLAIAYYFITHKINCALPSPAPLSPKVETRPPTSQHQVSAELKTFIEATKLNFIAEKTTLSPVAEKTLDALIERTKNENLRLEITGHTCSLGTRKINEIISLKRANTVKDALIKRGFSAQNIKVRGVADSEPIADNRTVSGRISNRRVSFKIL